MSFDMLSYLRTNKEFEVAYSKCLAFVQDTINAYIDHLELDSNCNCDWYFPISHNCYCIGLDKKTCNIWVFCDEECEVGTDADFDKYSVDVQNGNGFYNEDGMYVAFKSEDWIDDYT